MTDFQMFLDVLQQLGLGAFFMALYIHERQLHSQTRDKLIDTLTDLAQLTQYQRVRLNDSPD